MKKKMDKVLDSRLQDVVDKRLSAALSKHTKRIVQIEEASTRTVRHLSDVIDVIAKDHGQQMGLANQRIKVLEELNLKLISAGGNMVKLTQEALAGPSSSLLKIKEDVAELLKTSSEHFDSLSKALSLGTSSILDGLSNLKLDEAHPQSKRGEDEDNDDKYKRSLIDPNKVINLEKTPPSEEEEKETPPAEEEEAETTPPDNRKENSTMSGKGHENNESPKKTAHNDKLGPSSPKGDDTSSSFGGDDEE